jgi:hypothetical protein
MPFCLHNKIPPSKIEYERHYNNYTLPPIFFKSILYCPVYKSPCGAEARQGKSQLNVAFLIPFELNYGVVENAVFVIILTSSALYN